MRRLIIRHCSLVPGLGLTITGDPVRSHEPSIVFTPDPENLLFTLEVDQSITGPIRMPADGCELFVSGSIVDAGSADRATRVRGFVSKAINPFPLLTSTTPTVRLTIGNDGPHDLTLASVPVSIAGTAIALQAAIRGLGGSAAFSEASVVAVGDHVVAVAGTGESVVLEAAGTDATAGELGLDPASSTRPSAFLTAPLLDPPVMTAAAPEFNLRIGDITATVSGMATDPTDLDALIADLETRIRSADADPAFADARVARIDNRLLVVAGGGGPFAAATATTSDADTVLDLGLSIRAAIGAEPAGEGIGPAGTFSRSTINGPVVIREMPLASESIFVDPVWTQRQQIGCVRFSTVPIRFRTPRRHRCQPLDVQDANRIRPSFTTFRYGRPAYGQLGLDCPLEITAGAADEAEMGVFHDLHQHQRIANLRLRLDEFLRFGLEAGIVFAS